MNKTPPEDLRQVTIDTYNRAAPELAEYFAGIGSRVEDIDRAFEAAGNPERPNVLEIGCGDGRDAKDIVKRAKNYVGMDISEELIKIARAQVPQGKFEIADAVDYEFPKNLDIVFAFASLLHLDKSEVRTVFGRVAQVLRPGGIFYISSKYRPEYSEELQEDKFGRRLFYFYNAELMAEIAGNDYKVVRNWHGPHGHTKWFELVLRRQ